LWPFLGYLLQVFIVLFVQNLLWLPTKIAINSLYILEFLVCVHWSNLLPDLVYAKISATICKCIHMNLNLFILLTINLTPRTDRKTETKTVQKSVINQTHVQNNLCLRCQKPWHQSASFEILEYHGWNVWPQSTRFKLDLWQLKPHQFISIWLDIWFIACYCTIIMHYNCIYGNLPMGGTDCDITGINI